MNNVVGLITGALRIGADAAVWEMPQAAATSSGDAR